MRVFRHGFAAWLCVVALDSWAQDAPDIIALEAGRITWTNANPELYYSVEWVPSLLSNDWQGSYRSLQDIQSDDDLISADVPMFLRVVGSETPLHTRTLDPQSSFLEAGYYEAADLPEIAPELQAENIKSGVTLFGVAGEYEGESYPAASLTQDQVDFLIALSTHSMYELGSELESVIAENKGQGFNTSWIRVARFTPFIRLGNITVQFQLRVNSVFQPGTVEAQLRLDDEPAGAIHSTTSTSNVTFSDNLTVAPDQSLSVYVRHSASDVGSVTSDIRILVANPTGPLPPRIPEDAEPAPSF